MTKAFHKGDRVKWSWGDGEAEGEVEEVHKDRVERTLKGSKIVRNGTKDAPAYLIVQDGGDKVLKLHTEVSAA